MLSTNIVEETESWRVIFYVLVDFKQNFIYTIKNVFNLHYQFKYDYVYIAW